MRLFADDMAHSGSFRDVTSNPDDVTLHKLVSSCRLRRQSVKSELLSIGIDISKFESQAALRKRLPSDSSMDQIIKKLDDLEKRTASLHVVYDSLTERANELETRAKQCELEYSQRKTSFDILEFFIKDDGRSKAMFDHVSLFFYVLITKLLRKGVQISSTTELWDRLEDEDVKSAFENTVTNLGFSKKEVHSLNVILDTLHERDLTVNVDQSQVDTNNLTAKLNDLSSEFIVEHPETDEDDVASSQSVSCETSGNAVVNGIESSAYSERRCTDNGAASGDTYDVDSLLLYLQIQQELDPLIRSALRRAVAVAHCSKVKTSTPNSADNSFQDEDNPVNVNVDEIVPAIACQQDYPHDSGTDECPHRDPETPRKPKSFSDRSDLFSEIECEDDFDDLVTSTPKPKPSRPKDLNLSNNALEINDLFGPEKPKSRLKRRPSKLQIPKIAHRRDRGQSLSAPVDERRSSSGSDGNFNALTRIENMLSSQSSATPEEGKERVYNFRSFCKRRLRRKTAQLVKEERNSIKSLTSPCSNSSAESKPKVNFLLDSDQENRPPPPKFICEIYEPEHVNNFDEFSDSECNSACSSLLSSFYFTTSDNGSSLNPPDDEDRSISLHEELSEFGFIPHGTPKDSDCPADSTETIIEAKDCESQTESESIKPKKEHVNFFSSPNSNPYAYDFEVNYYMLWPGQEMEIELKDLSCEIGLDDIEDDCDNNFEKSNQSFTSSLTKTTSNTVKVDSWLQG